MRNAKAELARACSEDVGGEALKRKLQNIVSGLEKCRKQGVQDSDQDICVAETEKEFLQCKDREIAFLCNKINV